MKTVELEPSLVEDIKALLADEEIREKFLRTISRLKAKLTKQPENLTPYTVEELKERVAKGVADIRAGRVTPSEQVFKEIEEEFGWLSAEAEKLTPYTMEEINERIDKAEADIAAGRIISSEEMHRRMRNYLSTL